MALVSGNGSSYSANPSQISFALSSLVSVIEEQMLGDEELALVINRFSRFHNNRLNRRRCGGPKDGCHGYGDPDHFIAHYPKKNKNFSGKRKDKCEYTSGKHKSKGGFNKEELKKMYLKKAKA